MTGNREYKSDVFSMLMQDKENALQLYNAVNGSAYTDSSIVEICTLDKGISLSVRNDASFILDSNLSIYEHQSTVCPNMPVRNLIYFTTMVERMVKGHNIYGRSLVRIPVPKFAVFYNGDEEQPEQYEMKLSNAFEKPVENPQLELKCMVYNINFGKNKRILEECPVLQDYMTFVDYVRFYHRENDYEQLEHAIEQAIDRCIMENVLKDFLIQNRSEVVKVTQLDYTFERQITLERADARAEGRAEGHAEGHAEGRAEGRAEGYQTGCTVGRELLLIQMITAKMRKKMPVQQIADELELDAGYVQELYEKLLPYAPDYDMDKITQNVLPE